MAQRALITGVSGFVGGFLAEHLLDCGDMVMGTSPDGRWMATSPPALVDRVELVAWDLAETDGLPPAAAEQIAAFAPEAVYHLAAISVPQQCGDHEPTPLARAVNVEGTRRVVEWASRLPGPPRVLLVSSSHVYAPVRPEAPRVDENAPLAPRRGYGRTKRAAEQVVLDATRNGRCDGIVVRAFQHTGPRQHPKMMLPEWAQQVARGGDDPICVHTRDAVVDVTDVRDVVGAYRLLMEHGHGGQVYNVGSGVPRRSGDLLAMLLEIAGATDRPVEEIRPGRKQDPIAEIGRLVECTGWRARVSMEQTIFDTLQYWRRVAESS